MSFGSGADYELVCETLLLFVALLLLDLGYRLVFLKNLNYDGLRESSTLAVHNGQVLWGLSHHQASSSLRASILRL